MDPGFRTPLLDFFRHSEVADDIRLLAAQGALAPRAHEQLGLLILLVDDPDAQVRSAAEATLSALPRPSLEAFIARADVPDATRRFFAAREIHPAAVPAGDADNPLFAASRSEDDDDGASNRGTTDRPAVVQKIAGMTAAQRMALAMKGTREERTVLVRDPNRIVAISVLSSPQLTDTEVESIARMANVSEDVLRAIAGTRSWMKNYAICAALTKNAKTPLAISMNLIARLTDKDMRMLSIDRNVPDMLRITARKKITIERR